MVHKTDIVEGYESDFFVNESSVEVCDKALPIEQDRQCKGVGWGGVVISYISNVGEKRNGAEEERRTKQGGRFFLGLPFLSVGLWCDPDRFFVYH